MGNINWQEFKVRCSAITKVLANSQSNPTLTEKQAIRLSELEKKLTLTEPMKLEMAELLVKKDNSSKIILSDTCIDYLMEVYAWKTERMISVSKESMEIMHMKKGKLAEPESIKILSIVKGIIYEKNTTQVFNDFLTGEPDVFSGTEIMKAEVIEDTKTVWDYPTFLRCIKKPVEKSNSDQVKGYCDITGASTGYISKCLVSAPFEIIEDMKWKVAKRFGAVTIESPDFLEEWAKWEHSMIFDHMPVHKRVCSKPVEIFTDFERQKVYDRVKICRDYLSEFDEEYQKLNM